MELVFGFIAGALITNGVPHFVSGIAGNRHMTPLAKNSSALVNVAWAYVNFVLGIFVFKLSGGTVNQVFTFDNFSLSFLAGSFVLAVTAAWLFSNPNIRFPWFKE